MSPSHLLGRGDVARLLADNHLSARKSLGQNFVADPGTIDKIVRLAAIGPGDHVLEIGAGLGSLTFGLEASGAQVLAYEIDAGLAQLVRGAVGPSVTVIEQDVLSADLASTLADAKAQAPIGQRSDRPWVVVANLPYNIATPLVLSILESVPDVGRLVVMVQKEVADRFAAPPSNKNYGAVSVRIAYFARVRTVGKVSAEVFVPKPKIESAIVDITRRDVVAVDPKLCAYDELSRLVRAGFAHRRKMLRRALAGMVDEEAFVAAQIDPTWRAENLDVEQWGKLTGCQAVLSNARTPS